MSAVTRKVSEDLARRLGERKYDMWFGPATRFRIDGTRLEVIAESQYVADWIDSHFSTDLHEAANQAMGRRADVVIRVEQPPAKSRRRPKRAPAESLAAPDAAATTAGGRQQRSRRPRSADIFPHSLSDFVIGESNKLAHRAATHLAEAEQDGGLGPVFVYGECGLGKTHLLHGTCRRFLETHPGARVRYTTGEEFTNAYIDSLKKGSIESFRREARQLDLLAIDDVHFLSNKTSTQTEFLHTLDAIRMCGARIILASDEHPRHLRQINHALVNRFMAGIVTRIDRPDRHMRITLIRQFAMRRGMKINDRGIETIASHCTGSVREIEGALMKLDALRGLAHPGHSNGSATSNGAAGRNGAAAPFNGEIGCVLVESLFKSDAAPTRPIRVDSILECVCQRLGVDATDLLGSTRHRRVVLARGLISHLARELTTMSFPEIGRAVGRRNHSTVLTAARRVAEQIERGESIDLGDGSTMPIATLAEELRVQITRMNRI